MKKLILLAMLLVSTMNFAQQLPPLLEGGTGEGGQEWVCTQVQVGTITIITWSAPILGIPIPIGFIEVPVYEEQCGWEE
jgi:hypothetical protein